MIAQAAQKIELSEKSSNLVSSDLPMWAVLFERQNQNLRINIQNITQLAIRFEPPLAELSSLLLNGLRSFRNKRRSNIKIKTRVKIYIV
jgi:hypothetical protein